MSTWFQKIPQLGILFKRHFGGGMSGKHDEAQQTFYPGSLTKLNEEMGDDLDQWMQPDMFWHPQICYDRPFWHHPPTAFHKLVKSFTDFDQLSHHSLHRHCQKDKISPLHIMVVTHPGEVSKRLNFVRQGNLSYGPTLKSVSFIFGPLSVLITFIFCHQVNKDI